MLGRIEEIELPKGCGRGKTQVYYLTSKGAKVLARVAPSLIKQARPGRPRGANRARIPHELLVAEVEGPVMVREGPPGLSATFDTPSGDVEVGHLQ